MFHEKLGTVADKVERVAKLAEWLVSLEGNGFDQSSPGDALHGEVTEAARLCKADLVTEMVGEFPDLQGLMGGYYAEKQGQVRSRRQCDPRSLSSRWGRATRCRPTR